MGSITDLIISTTKRLVNNGGFEVELTIIPTGLEPVIIKGIAFRHSQQWNADGQPIIGTNAHCFFNESDLNDLGITTRDSNQNILVKDWLISWTDAVDTYEYKINEPYPDNTLGSIRCTLSNLT